jgi:hypothetical protein
VVTPMKYNRRHCGADLAASPQGKPPDCGRSLPRVAKDGLIAVEARARESRLPGVTITKGFLRDPIEKTTPPEAEALAERLYSMLPRIRVTDLLAEVARWTRFPDCFTHLRSGEVAADGRILMRPNTSSQIENCCPNPPGVANSRTAR